MSVILINPVFSDPDPYCPPLGLGYLAAVLEQKNIPVSIIDMNVENLDTSLLMDRIQKAHPVLVGLSSTIRNADSAIALGRDLSKAGIPIVHGGSDPSIDPEKYLFMNPESLVLRGEAEYSFLELAMAILQGKEHYSIPGLSFRNGDAFAHNSAPAVIKNLDSLPFPARHLFLMEHYTARLGRRKATSIIGSRSCPYQCIFCHAHSLPNHRQRTPKNILHEVELLVHDYGYKGFYFYDCTFTTNKRRVMEFCNLLLQANLDIEWQCMSRVDQLDLETMQLMRQAGCVRVAVGAESGSERSLKLMKKGINTRQIENFFADLKVAGIRTRGYFILGFPWETSDDFQATYDLVKRIHPDEVAVSFATPLPGTELHTMVSGSYPLTIHHNSLLMGKPAFIPSGFSEQNLFEYRDLINKFVEGIGGSL
jgi:anaerobic magnesium-protoporphyrin IX monomethyl ester cyclase